MRKLFLLSAMLLLSCCLLPVRADKTAVLREKLPHLKGVARLQALKMLQDESINSPDIDYQVRCLNDLTEEAYVQGDNKLFAASVLERAVLFYNNDMVDSIEAYVPRDLERLKGNKAWDRVYELWTHLVNTYIFSGHYNTALRQVQAMMEDAKSHDNKYGMGIAYYAMGNVYANMHNLDESGEAYRKSLNLLKAITPLPPTIPDIYSYYGDLLNDKKDYQELERLTVEWKEFLETFHTTINLDQQFRDIQWAYYYLACTQAALGLRQFDHAAEMLAEVDKRKGQGGDFITMPWLFYSAQYYLGKGDYRKALEMNGRRMIYEDGEDVPVRIMILNQRGEILRRLGRFEEAANVYSSIIDAKDSISGAETRNQLNEMNTLFHVDELQREQEHMRMEQERAQFRSMLLIVGIILVGLAVFTVFRLRAAKRLKKAHDELLVAYDQLEETTTAKERIESDLRIARDIQMGMVPSTFPDRPDLDLFASMTPAKEVGGDLYGYLMMGDRLYFALGDVSGKGVPASLFMAQATRLFRTLAAQQMMPAEIATRINDALSGEDNETGMFVTMFLGLVDLTTGHLDFCNAGHNPPVLLRDGKSEFIEMEPNAPIGLWPGLEYVGEEIADITNCPFFVYTDGLNEAENRQQEQFTDERLLEILETHPFESSRQTIELLREEVEKHRDGAEPNDDLTMLCVKVIRDITTTNK